MSALLQIHPYPRIVRLRPGELSLSEAERSAVRSAGAPEAPAPEALPPRVVAEREAGLGPQAYALRVDPGGIRLRYGDEPGLRYGLHSLRQLLANHPRQLPGLEIEDGPDFLHRGFMLDVSRCKVPTLATLRGLLDLLADYRYNQFQLYIEHTFAFRDHGEVWRHASPYTAEDIRVIDDMCRARGIELVPNFNSFGHFERWLCHPAYRHLAESPDGFVHPLDGKRRTSGSTLRPDAASIRFLAGLYDEFLPNFRSGWFNIGGDEPWELGKGASRERVERKGEGAVYLDFLKRLHAEVGRRGRTMLFWGDLINRHPECIPELPSDCIALNWGYEADSPHAEQLPRFRGAGIPFYVCPGTSSWRSLTGRWSNARQNLRNAAIEGKRNGALGYLVTDWGDGGHHQVPEISWPGILAGGHFAWNAAAVDEVSVEAEIDRLPQTDGLRDGCGSLITGLGELIDGGPWTAPNRGLFRELLFDDRTGRSLADAYGLDVGTVREFRDRLNGLGTRLEGLGERRSTVCRELGWTLKVCHAALDRCGFEASANHRATGDDLLREFRSLWLARNREGGLAESHGLLSAKLTER